MVVTEQGGAVERLLAEGEGLIKALSDELAGMRSARDVLQDNAVQSVRLLEGMGEFLGDLAKLTDVVGAVAQELESRSLAVLVAGVERQVSEDSVLVQRAVSVGNESVLAELREVRAELGAVKALAGEAAGKKGLFF